MRKTFPLHLPDRADARVIEAIKHELRKYVKRERRKKLPEGFTTWEFDCRVGPGKDAAEARALDDVPAAIDTLAQTDATEAYIEILARPAQRPTRVPPVAE